MRISLFVATLWLLVFQANAQTDIRKIHALANYVKTIPFAEFPNSFGFFDDTAATPGCIYYVYASYSDSVKSVSPGKFYYYHSDSVRAKHKRDSLRSAGMHTLLLETPTNTGCWIAQCLYELSPEEAGFMILHEAMHYTYLRKQPDKNGAFTQKLKRHFAT